MHALRTFKSRICRVWPSDRCWVLPCMFGGGHHSEVVDEVGMATITVSFLQGLFWADDFPPFPFGGIYVSDLLVLELLIFFSARSQLATSQRKNACNPSGASVLYPGIPSIAGQMAFSFITNATWQWQVHSIHGEMFVVAMSWGKNYWEKNQRDLSSLSHVCCVSCVRRCPRKPRNRNIFLFTVFTHLLLETSRQNKAKLQNTIDQSPSKKVLEMPRNDWTPFQIFGKTDATSTDVTMCWPKRFVPNQS